MVYYRLLQRCQTVNLSTNKELAGLVDEYSRLATLKGIRSTVRRLLGGATLGGLPGLPEGLTDRQLSNLLYRMGLKQQFADTALVKQAISDAKSKLPKPSAPLPLPFDALMFQDHLKQATNLHNCTCFQCLLCLLPTHLNTIRCASRPWSFPCHVS